MLVLTTLGVGLVSAVVPMVNMEVYLGVVAARLPDDPSAWLTATVALAAGLGQGIGKLVWYLAAARSFESAWVQRRLARGARRVRFELWRARVAGRPWLTVGVLLVSSVVGVPPLFLMSAVAGTLQVPLAVFLPTVVVGRSVRFWCVLTGVALVVG